MTSIVGDNISAPGQVSVGSYPSSPTHTVRKGDINALRAIVRDLNLNSAAPSDLSTIGVESAKYIPRRIIVCNATANLSSAELAIYSAAAGGGTQIVAPVLLASLTAAGKFQVLTIAALTDPITAVTLYPRLSIAAGVAGTVDLMLEYDDISDL